MQYSDAPRKVVPIDKVMGAGEAVGSNLDSSILLDKDERELVRKGDEVTKQEMWELLENKRFEKLKSSAVNL